MLFQRANRISDSRFVLHDLWKNKENNNFLSIYDDIKNTDIIILAHRISEHN